MLTSRQTGSTLACWRRCGQRASCQRSGCPMRTPSAGDDWWLTATRSLGNRTRIKNAVHAILQAASYHAVPACRVRANFDPAGTGTAGRRAGRNRSAFARTRPTRRGCRVFDREIAQEVIEDPSVKRLLTITGVNVIVAAGLVAAIGDIRRFSSSQKLVSYVGLNPRVRQSGLGLARPAWPHQQARS